jgi:hypothetical protein
VFDFRQARSSQPSSRAEAFAPPGAAGAAQLYAGEAPRIDVPRELPDVTGFLVVVLVTLGLFVVPVGATIMQGPAIVASLLGR